MIDTLLGLQPDRILFINIRIRIRILTNTDIRIRIFSDTDTDMDTIWNLKLDTNADTNNYPDPEVLKF
jgi:hypothetical protein